MRHFCLSADLGGGGLSFMACITFVTLGATKAEKLSALQLDQEGLYIFFQKAKTIKSCLIMLALQPISRLWWLHI